MSEPEQAKKETAITWLQVFSLVVGIGFALLANANWGIRNDMKILDDNVNYLNIKEAKFTRGISNETHVTGSEEHFNCNIINGKLDCIRYTTTNKPWELINYLNDGR